MLTVNIVNDDTGNVNVGNYDYEVLINSTVIARGRVEGYDRSKRWQSLIRQLLYNDYKDGPNV